MAVKVGINGFGRIGRISFRAMAARGDEFEIVGINDLADPQALAVLLKYDSVHGRFPGTVEADGQALIVNGKKVPVYSERNPADLPWGEIGCEVALEATGIFATRKTESKPGYDSHLDAGAKKVVLSQPAKDAIDRTVVMGVNDDTLEAGDKCVSNASCTTNCLSPMVKVLNDEFGLEYGLMTTIHAYTNDQNVADQIHKDLHRARAAAVNIIPTTTGAAKAVGQVIPAVDGKLTGFALRVPGAVRVRHRPHRHAEKDGVRGRHQRRDESRVRRCLEGDSRLHRGPDRLLGHRRRPAFVHLRRGVHDGHRPLDGEGDGLVRQRVRLLQPHRGPDRPGRGDVIRRQSRGIAIPRL